ncbi:glucosyl transferase family 2 [Erysipelotrichaceae bacterium MTC7]|nr:glucosyl transferase family 2 [Erysipelotrichaceae bacterium MTC7]
METISVIVPCYNEEESIPHFYEETRKELLKIEHTNYEFIFVNDGSSDQTIHEIKLLTLQDPCCHYLSFSRNFGKESAMFAGLQRASGDYCVIMDADLQHPPTLLKDMYHVLKYENYDCAAGKRMDRTGEGGMRNFLSKQFYKVISALTKMDMSDGSGDFRMMRRVVVDAILEMKEYNRYMKGIFSFVGFDTKWLEFHNVERVAGQTKWSLKSLFAYAFEGILSFSTKPLLLAGIVGMLLFALSTILGLSIVVRLCLQESISASFYLLTALVFLSSLQMIFVSILGQYISKDYLENKKRPIYIIKESDNA